MSETIKLKVIAEFNDTTNEDKRRKVDETIEVDESRAALLIVEKVAERVDKAESTTGPEATNKKVSERRFDIGLSN